jgi:D-sedoheptulose 7-phosphate isomerase
MPRNEKSWGLVAAAGLGLDTDQYSRSGGNIHNTGANGWYQGKGTVNATPINFAGFFAELPRAVTHTEATAGGTTINMKLDKALTHTRTKFLACHKSGARVIFVGNGGSAAIASHMAVDYSKNGGVRAMAFNDVPTLTCLANDFGYDNVFSKQLEYYATKRDVVAIISSSGRSLNILAAARAAHAMGCYVVTFTGMNPNNALRAAGDFNYWVPSADYGIVELTHLSLLHSMVDIRLPRERASAWAKKR